MGVKGLWELLHPVARPIKLETLAGKHLAIDASIWLHQFLRGMRDKEGNAVGNAHLIGFFRRICKLLYFNIKPIFVYDGGTPALKRLTIQERRKRKRNDAMLMKRTAEKLLAAQLRLRALEQKKAARKRKAQDKEDGVVHDSTENPNYLEDLTRDEVKKALGNMANTTAMSGVAGDGTSGTKTSQARRIKDKYVLPPMETDFETLAKLRSTDERFGRNVGEDEIHDYLEGFKKEGGVADIDSDVFKALPVDLQREILSDIRMRSRVTSYERVQEMVRASSTPMDFSKLQVEGVIRRNTVTHKLLSVDQALSKVDQAVKPGRIASQRNRQYMLVKNEEGGWILGGKGPVAGASADKPVQLDSDDEKIKEEEEEEKESDWESEDEVDFEEVKIPQVILGPTLTTSHHQSPHSDIRPKASVLRPIAPKQTVKVDDDDTSLLNHLEAYVDEDESIEKVMAKFAEIEQGQARSRQHTNQEYINEDNGLHLISSTAVTEDDRMQQQHPPTHLSKGDLRIRDEPSWPEVLTDEEEFDSFDTLNSDNTIDFGHLEDLAEDDETGEIISRSLYHQRQQSRAGAGRPVVLEASGRALPTKDECKLDDESFLEYWTGYTPDAFKVKYPDEYEILLQSAIYEWDEDRLESEFHSASRKLEKSNVNDTIGMEALKFWKEFLESVVSRLEYQVKEELEASERSSSFSSTSSPSSSSTTSVQDAVIVLQDSGGAPRTKSLLSKLVVVEDDDDVEDGEEEGTPRASEDEFLANARDLFPGGLAMPDHVTQVIAPPTMLVQAPEVSLQFGAGQGLTEMVDTSLLDFGSSILQKRAPSTLSTSSAKSGITTSSVAESSMTNGTSATTGTNLVDEGVDVASHADTATSPHSFSSSQTGSGIGSAQDLLFENEDRQDMGETATVVAVEDHQTLEDLNRDGEVMRMDEDDDTTLGKDALVAVPEDEMGMDLGNGQDDEEEDEEEEPDLENEEQDATTLFPEMADLPGVIPLTKDRERSPSSPPSLPPPPPTLLSAEEQALQEQAEATQMFQESKALQSEIKVLQDQNRKHQRDADDLTESMVSETQLLLKLFGIPYIVAPMEAEAQCADLQLRGMVDGILTEDSDVFLFGGMRVFKNMFKEEKYVECYLLSDIERDLGVGRDRLVALAYLLGSDYTVGIKGIGLVTAMEILRLFPKLENFARWWRGEQAKEVAAESGVAMDGEVGKEDMEQDSVDEIALEKLAKLCKKIHVPTHFPDPHVAEAYLKPLVDEDETKFQWGIPDLEGLRDYLRQAMGWDRGEVDKVLLPLIRQMSSANANATGHQMTLDGFFDVSVGTGAYQPTGAVRKNLHKSARLRKVVNKLTGQQDGVEDGVEKKKKTAAGKRTPVESAETPTSVQEKKPRKKAAVTKKKQKKAQEGKDDDTVLVDNEGGVDSGDDDDDQVVVVADDDDEDDEDDEEGFVDVQVKKRARKTPVRTKETKIPESVMAGRKLLQSKNVEARLAARNKNRAAAAAAALAAVESSSEVSMDVDHAEEGEMTTPPTTVSASASASATPGSSKTTVSKKRRSLSDSESGGSTSGESGSDGDGDGADDFAPSHWDILAEKQKQQQLYQQQQRGMMTKVAGSESLSAGAGVAVGSPKRYGKSFLSMPVKAAAAGGGGKKKKAAKEEGEALGPTTPVKAKRARTRPSS